MDESPALRSTGHEGVAVCGEENRCESCSVEFHGERDDSKFLWLDL